jgi:hypothetical protein
MPDAEDLEAKLAQARRELAGNPHVVGVGFGYKERGGVTTQELALRVYVREKKPPSALSPDELVPRELLGIQTDVITVPDTQDFACDIIDSFSPLVGGIQITNLKKILGGGTDVAAGTLGCFATVNQSTSRDNIVVLTNRHVLEDTGGQVGDTLYQPRLVRDNGGFQPLRTEDRHAIGSIENLGVKSERAFKYPEDTGGPASYYLDCGIAHVDTCYSSWCDTNCGVGWRNEIKGLGIGTSEDKDALAGIARVRNADLPPGGDYVVYKVGRTTGRTVGKVKDAAATIHNQATNTDRHNCVLVDHLGPNCENGTRFSDEGDSGAVIVNEQRKVIALLFGGNPAGVDGHGCHIHPVVDALGVTVISTEHNPDASGSNALLEASGVDGAAIARAAGLREQILRDEHVRTLRGLVERHRDEVAHLVNRVRRVTVAWHRVRGPDFVAHAVHASRHADHHVPREVGGVGRDEAIRQMLDALRQNGSAPLRRDLELHAESVRALVAEVDDLEGLAALTRSRRGPA